MAASTLRIVRRPKGSGPSALTAASAPVTDPAKIFAASTWGVRRNWQDEAWVMYRLVGELRYYVGWRASSCSRARLVASEIDPDTGLPTGGIAEDNREGMRFAEIVGKIAGGPLGQAQLIKRTAEVLTVPGELWIAILMRTEGQGAQQRRVEKWYAVTRKEIEPGTRNDTVLIKLPDGAKHEFNPGNGDGMFRVWNSDAEDASEPDSPVRACLDPLREIVRTTRKISNADNSRLINNGILFVPSEASLPDPQSPVSADKPGAPPPPPQSRQVATTLQKMIVQVAETAYKDENSMAALVPIVASAPGEHLAKIHHQEFGKDVTEVALKTRTEAIARLAMGLDLAPERLLGLGKNSNHWTAHQIGDEDVQLHVAPVLETICQAIYDSVLRNMLAAEGVDASKYVLWYDTSRLTADPDKTDEAKDAFAQGAITGEALVRYYGLSEDSMYDFSTLDGWQQWAQDKVSQDPSLLRHLLPLLDRSVQAIEFPSMPAIEQRDPDPEGDEESDPGSEPDTEDDEPDGGAAVDENSRTQLAVDLMVSRAMDLAGKRLRTTSRTHDPVDVQRFRGVAARDVHRFMGPVDRAEIPRLIKGWDAGLDELLVRYNLDPGQIRSAVYRQVQRELTSEVIDAEVG